MDIRAKLDEFQTLTVLIEQTDAAHIRATAKPIESCTCDDAKDIWSYRRDRDKIAEEIVNYFEMVNDPIKLGNQQPI